MRNQDDSVAEMSKGVLNFVNKYTLPAMDYQFPEIQEQKFSTLTSKSRK